MKTTALDRAEGLSAHAIMRGVCPAPTRVDPHPFLPFVAYLTVLCPVTPDPWAPGEDVGYDDRYAGLLRSACAIRDHLLSGTADLDVARIQVETLRGEAAALAKRLDAEPLDIADDNAERAITGTVRVAQIAEVCLVGCGDSDALESLARSAETCAALGASGYMEFSVGARQVLAMPEGLGVWLPGRPPIPAIGTAMQVGRNALAQRDALAQHDAAARAKRRPTHAEEMDDDRAEIVRRPPARPKAAPATPAPEAFPPAEPEAQPEPALSLVVFPALKHLPQPSLMARDRGDSPRALCEPVAEVALPLVPAPDPATVAATLNAAFPWAAEVTEQYASDLVGAPYAMLKPRTLVGGQGGGKTAYARAVLKALGLPEIFYSAAGVMDGGNFAGASRTWSTWRLSVPAQGVLRFRLASLGCIIDEAEKAGPSRRWGRLDETLLPFLERGSTAKAVFDPALEVPLNLSGVSYILTANSRDGVSGPLLDRAPPVQWPMPRREDLPVAAGAILDEIRRERGLDEAWCPALDGNELDALMAWRGGSLRPLRRMVETVVASREQFARLMPN